MILASLSKGLGKAKGEQLEQLREGWGEDWRHLLLALPALIGRSRQGSRSQTSRDHDSSQKVFD